jgi:phage shock protein C
MLKVLAGAKSSQKRKGQEVSKEKRDAERAARRARRLAERAEERARRKEQHARHAAERAERLAERVNRRPPRERDLEKSIEDLVDDVAQKAEHWIEEQTKGLFDYGSDGEDLKQAEGRARRARKDADKARETANKVGQAAADLTNLKDELAIGMEDELTMDMDEDFDVDFDEDDYESLYGADSGRRRSRKRGRRKYGYGRHWTYEWGFGSRSRARRRRSAHLYRDRQRKKVCGVCAGFADYFGRPTWEMRLYAVLGLMFLPSIVIPSYFVAWFLMDDKPYYRRVTDRFDAETRGRHDESSRGNRKRRGRGEKMKQTDPAKPVMNNVQAMKTAKQKFSDIEQRLRVMETHVTSSRFELNQEFKKISGED